MTNEAKPTPKRVAYACASCGSEFEVSLVDGLLPSSAKCPKCSTVYTFPTQTQPKDSGQWTPEQIEGLIKLVETVASKYLTFKKDESEASHRELRTIARYNSILTGILALFLAAIVGLMSYLAFEKTVSGDALLFLVGTITGYILLFIQRLTKTLLTGNEDSEG